MLPNTLTKWISLMSILVSEIENQDKIRGLLEKLQMMLISKRGVLTTKRDAQSGFCLQIP